MREVSSPELELDSRRHEVEALRARVKQLEKENEALERHILAAHWPIEVKK